MNWWNTIFLWWITSWLFIFSFIWRYFDFVIKFCFLNGHKFTDVINVCCCCLILPLVFARFLNIGISHQPNASFFTPLSYLLCRLSFRSYTSFFLKNTWIFCVFLSVPLLVDNYARIVDEWGRNLMCNRTLPSRLVCILKIFY